MNSLSTEAIPLPENRASPLEFTNDSFSDFIKACEAGNQEMVQDSIRNGVDVNQLKESRRAIDVALEKQHYHVVLTLLKADSLFSSFDKNVLAQNEDLRTFFNERDKLHALIKENNQEEVKRIITSNRSKYYLNQEGNSALLTALKSKQYKMYALLQTNGTSWKDNREKAELRFIDRQESDRLKEALVPYFIQSYDAHIMYLVSKSKSSTPIKNLREKLEKIYRDLDAIPEVSAILKVTQYSDNIDVIFDFNNESIIDIDPTSSTNTKGKCLYEKGRIYIGAKNETELPGIVAHELSHWTMQFIYNNDCNPYESGSEKKDEFETIIKQTVDLDDVSKDLNQHKREIREKAKDKDMDDIIKRVFSYNTPEWASELIVRVPHMLAKYGANGRDKLQDQAPELYEYYQKTIMATCTEFVQNSFLIKPRVNIKLLNDYSGLIDRIAESGILFNNETIELDLKTFLNSNQQKMFIIVTQSTFLGCINVYQYLRKIPNYSSPDRYLCFRIDKYKNQENKIKKCFPSEACNLLILQDLENDGEPKNIEKDLMPISSVKSKIIFLTQRINTFNLPGIAFKEMEYTLTDLSPESIENILQKEVTFQNSTVNLAQLIKDSQERKYIVSETLTKLVNGDQVVIGKQLQFSDEIKGCVETYFIDRQFSYPTLKQDVLKDSQVVSLFAISNIDAKSLETLLPKENKAILFEEYSEQNSHRFIILDSNLGKAESQFQELCKDHQRIHCLRWESNHLIWLQSKGDQSELEKYKSIQNIPEADLLKSSHKVMLISDTAGMGKSTVLAHLAQVIKNAAPHQWTLFLNLNDCTVQLAKAKKETNFSNRNRIISFLSENLLKLETRLERELFRHKLEKSGGITLLFDSFDEISPDYKNVVIDIIKTLRDTAVEKIWITTRPYMSKPLEVEFGIFPFTLKPFSCQDQRDFLTKFWTKSAENVDSEQLITQIVESISSRDKEQQFLGIPMHTKMVAEIYEDKFKKSETISKLLEFVPQNIAKLYEQFIQKKFENYSKEKKMDTITNVAVLNDNQDLFKIFIRRHQLLAINVLLKEEEQQQLFCADEITEYISRIKDGKEKTGIIDRVDQDDKPHFIHQTFAEYFFADFFAKYQDEYEKKVHEFLLTSVLLKPHFKTVRAFLDGYLALNKEKIKFDADLIQNLWQKEGRKLCNRETNETIFHFFAQEDNINLAKFILSSIQDKEIIKDLLNTKAIDGTALERSAANYKWDMVKLLVEHGADDNGDGMTALQTATFKYEWKIVIWLLDHGNADVNKKNKNGLTLLDVPDGRRHLEIEKYMTSYEYDQTDGWTPLHMAARTNQSIVVKKLIEKGANVNAKAQNGKTVLNVAIRGGSLEIVKLLIKKGAEIEIEIEKFYQNTFYSKEILDWLNDVDISNKDETVIHLAAVSGQWKFIKRKVEEKNMDVNARDKFGYTLLHLAVNYSHNTQSVEMVGWLVEKGANLLARNWHDSTLHRAISSGSEKMIRFLLKKMKENLDQEQFINSKDNEGDTPLMWAIENKKINLVRILLEHNFDLTITNNGGMTALHWAVDVCSLEIIECLVEKNALLLEIKDNKGKTALDQALEKENREIIDYLRQKMTTATNVESQSHLH